MLWNLASMGFSHQQFSQLVAQKVNQGGCQALMPRQLKDLCQSAMLLSDRQLEQVSDQLLQGNDFRKQFVGKHLDWWFHLLPEIRIAAGKQVLHHKAMYQISNFQREVAKLLREHISIKGLREEYIVEGIGITVDAYFVKDGYRWVVEADGPHHFSLNSPHVVTQSTIVRNKLLDNIGIQVISIPFYQWVKCDTENKKLGFLRGKLSQLMTQAQIRSQDWQQLYPI
eukprot:TRINITY_DN8034_c0_g3_i1.p2 TRINITY_DN8034_c0_g3~~TRINITY_DN8034_c0_g3_i1.p2  ORF type:complete len:226 (+),score=31.36 TRINITY_DN8034_c0_g3_i1:225-902(+)